MYAILPSSLNQYNKQAMYMYAVCVSCFIKHKQIAVIFLQNFESRVKLKTTKSAPGLSRCRAPRPEPKLFRLINYDIYVGDLPHC